MYAVFFRVGGGGLANLYNISDIFFFVDEIKLGLIGKFPFPLPPLPLTTPLRWHLYEVGFIALSMVYDINANKLFCFH